jgi:hypothetical protein
VPIENGGTNATSIVGAKENLLLNNVDNTGCIKTYKYSYIRCLVVKRRSVKQEVQMANFCRILMRSIHQRATKTYIDAAVASGVVDASFNRKKGKLKLAGDIGGTADLPTVPGLLLKEPLIAQGQMTDYYRER